MIDSHSHILFDVDDGSDSIEESIELLKKLQSIGFEKVILTPHYIEGSHYNANNLEKINKFNILKEAINNNNLEIDIFLGNEIFINNNIIDLIRNREIYSLNGTRYLLIELPFENKVLNLEDILYELKYHKIIPVIAHPERYVYFQDNPQLIKQLRDDNILFQLNYSSVLGYYGKRAQKLAKYLLKNQYVDFLGTDIHHIKKSYVIDNFVKINKKICKIAGKEYYYKLISNGNKLIDGSDVNE